MRKNKNSQAEIKLIKEKILIVQGIYKRGLIGEGMRDWEIQILSDELAKATAK